MTTETGIRGTQWLIVIGIMIGLIFIVTGAIVTGIAYTEITPPDYDDNYHRYIGSSVRRLLGPFILAFGAVMLIGSCGFFGWQYYKEYEPTEQEEHYEDDDMEYNGKGSQQYDQQ